MRGSPERYGGSLLGTRIVARGRPVPRRRGSNAAIQNVHRISCFEHSDARRLGRATRQPEARPQWEFTCRKRGSRSTVQDTRRNLNPVIRWNRIANEIFPVDVGPVIDSRAMAILHAAVHDAVNGVERRYEPYTVALSSPGASLDAAVASAARDVMLTLTHNQRPRIEQEYAKALASVPDGPAKDQGVALGQQAARANLDRRADDGITPGPWPPRDGPITEPVYVPTGKPGDYDFTPPFDAPPLGPIALFPGLGRLTPFVDRPVASSSRRTRSVAQQALRARSQLPEVVRQASDHVANRRSDHHGVLLVRAVRDLERHRHDGHAAGTCRVPGGPRAFSRS